jgi:hypothetical protein
MTQETQDTDTSEAQDDAKAHERLPVNSLDEKDGAYMTVEDVGAVWEFRFYVSDDVVEMFEEDDSRYSLQWAARATAKIRTKEVVNSGNRKLNYRVKSPDAMSRASNGTPRLAHPDIRNGKTVEVWVKL